MAKKAYISPIPNATEVRDWRSSFSFSLVQSIVELEEIRREFQLKIRDKGVNNFNGILSVDTETTSLCHKDADIVGFSFSFRPGEGYYVPIAHRVGENVAVEAIDILNEMMYEASRVLFFNYRYDMRILRKYKADPFRINHFDVQVLVWNMDTNIVFPSLKDSSLKYLGIQQVTYEDLVGRNNVANINLSFFPANSVVEYACVDAISPLLIYKRLYGFYMKQIRYIVDLDNALLEAIMFNEETPIKVDTEYAKALHGKYVKERNCVLQEIRQTANLPFDVNSPRQLQAVLRDMGVPLSVKTEKGMYSTREESIVKFADKFPIVRLLLEYREKQSVLSRFIEPFVKNNLDVIYIKYSTVNAPTGRLASGGKEGKSGDKSFFFPFNIQAMLKPSSQMYSFERVEDEDSILGYRFKPESNGNVKGYEVDNVRRIVRPHPGHYVVSSDYDVQELIIAANLSGDRVWIDAVLKGEDIHDSEAKRYFFKQTNHAKKQREIAKKLNYSCIYFGSAHAIARQLKDKSLVECKEYHRIWRETHKAYVRYMEKSMDDARRKGYIKTPMQRIRRLDFWFNSSHAGDRGFAERSTANTQIQGAGADIMRYVLVRLFKEIYCDPRYRGKLYFMGSIHDALVHSVTREPKLFTEIVNRVNGIMVDLPFRNWPLPMTVSVEVGNDWGSLFPFKYRDGEWRPVETKHLTNS